MTSASSWFASNPWAIGIILLLVGPFIALKGDNMFRWVAGTVGAVAAFGLTFIVLAAFGAADTSAGFWVSLIVSALAAGVAFWLLFTKIDWAIGIVGAVGGYFAGTVIFTLLLAMFDWTALWAMLLISIGFAIVGFLVAKKWDGLIIRLATSGLGSYMFMRAWTYFIGGYPSEYAIYASLTSDVDPLTWGFWIYFAFFLITWVFSFWWQTKEDREQELVDAFKRS